MKMLAIIPLNNKLKIIMKYTALALLVAGTQAYTENNAIFLQVQ